MNYVEQLDKHLCEMYANYCKAFSDDNETMKGFATSLANSINFFSGIARYVEEYGALEGGELPASELGHIAVCFITATTEPNRATTPMGRVKAIRRMRKVINQFPTDLKKFTEKYASLPITAGFAELVAASNGALVGKGEGVLSSTALERLQRLGAIDGTTNTERN